jgi:hypothetical protein
MLPDDILPIEDCVLLPLGALQHQIALRELQQLHRQPSIATLYETVRLRDLAHEVAAREAGQTRETLRLELSSGKGSFTLLVDDDKVSTCYQMRGETSLSADCTREALVEFARKILSIVGDRATQ